MKTENTQKRTAQQKKALAQLCLALLCAGAADLHAETRTVSNLHDSGPGSLRDTIAASIANDTIDFSLRGTIVFTNGPITIGRSLNIIGPPAPGINLDGNRHSRLFNIPAGITVSLSNLTISDGYTPSDLSGIGDGGAIYNSGTLNLNNCTFVGNVAQTGGGAIENRGTLTASNCAFSSNRTLGNGTSNGGAIDNDNGGPVTLNNCLFSDNICSGSAGYGGFGGAIANAGVALTINNSTFYGNSCVPHGWGGAIFVYNLDDTLPVKINDSTFWGNSCSSAGESRGGGICLVDFGSGIPVPHTIIVKNTIIAGNSAPSGPDFAGYVASLGHNLIGKTNHSVGWVGSDLTGSIDAPLDPLLGPLRDNGGPTRSMMPQNESAAIDAGDDSVLSFLATDQRGNARRSGRSVDIGAVERGPTPLTAVSGSTLVPGGSGRFGQLPAGLGVSGGNRIFFGVSTGGQQGIYGINNFPVDPVGVPQDPIKIADLNTPIPGGSGNFTSFTGSGGIPPDPCISGSNAVFWATGAGGQQGIYAWPNDPIFPNDPLKIADLNTPIPPGGLGNFAAFTLNPAWPPDPCISGHTVAFYGAAAGGLQGIYTGTLDGALTRIADTTTPTPGSTDNDHFIAFYLYHPGDPWISGRNVTFSAYSNNGSNSITAGVYLSTDGVLSRVADNTTLIPGGTGYFYDFASDSSPGGPQVSAGNVLFWGNGSDGQQGLYVKFPQDPVHPVDPWKVVADTNTSIPGGSGNFTGFSAMSLSADTVAFIGLGAGGQRGIYLAIPQDPLVPVDPMYKVIDLNDVLDGKTITGFQLSRTGLDRNCHLLAFGATFTDGSQGLYTVDVFTGLLAALNCPPTVTQANDPGRCGATVNYAVPTPNGVFESVTCIPASGSFFGVGDTTVTCTSATGASCSFHVIVNDTEPPKAVTSVATASLWPPNHELINVGFKATATDNCSGKSALTVQVFSDEREDAPGDCQFSPDAKDVAPGTLRLRSERFGDGDGRVYLIVTTASDGSGNKSHACATVVVPRDQTPAYLASVNAQAAAAKAFCQAHDGAVPPGFARIGIGPVIGPKQ